MDGKPHFVIDYFSCSWKSMLAYICHSMIGYWSLVTTSVCEITENLLATSGPGISSSQARCRRSFVNAALHDWEREVKKSFG